jgi:hypothetical protein
MPAACYVLEPRPTKRIEYEDEDDSRSDASPPSSSTAYRSPLSQLLPTRTGFWKSTSSTASVVLLGLLTL